MTKRGIFSKKVSRLYLHPFGNPLERVGTTSSGFGYTGQQVDSTGLVYLRARYYDSLTGRFISKDPFPGLSTLPQTQNPYPYVVNNPVNHTDPSGELFDAAFDVALALTDLGLLGYHTYQWWNECDPSARQALEQQMALDATSFMINAAFFFIPGATGGGQFYRGGRLAFAHGGMVSAGSLAQAATETAMVTRRMAQGATKVGQAYLMASKNDGWKAGDRIDQPSTQGNYPSWETVRGRYWQNRARSANRGEFNSRNIGRMKKGYAPVTRIIARMKDTGKEVEMLVSKEIHHITGRSGVNPHAASNLIEVWPWEHASIDSSRYINYEFVRFK